MSGKKQVLLILADGFEEIEAATAIDVLRRAEFDVVVAGLGKTSVTGAHGLGMQADVELSKFEGAPDAVVLPGGMPGATNLAASSAVTDWVRKTFAAKKLVAAICASPAVVLAPLGILDGKKATCYPGFEERFGPRVVRSSERVVEEGNVITSRGPGTALEFSLAVVTALAGQAVADRLAGDMVLRGIRL